MVPFAAVAVFLGFATALVVAALVVVAFLLAGFFAFAAADRVEAGFLVSFASDAGLADAALGAGEEGAESLDILLICCCYSLVYRRIELGPI